MGIKMNCMTQNSQFELNNCKGNVCIENLKCLYMYDKQV